MEAELNLSEWQAQKAIDNIEKCCAQYHTGEDGMHIVWPDVKLELSSRMTELYK